MPYVDPSDRKELEEGRYPSTAGELNYLVTKLAVDYIEANGHDYATCNDVLGALEGAKQEFYRRVAAPYEDQKCRINGDVYPVTVAPAIVSASVAPKHRRGW